MTTASAFAANVRAAGAANASDNGRALIAVARQAYNSLPEVALAALAGTGRRVRLFYGDPATGRDWGDENDVTGYVGRSTGTDKVPLLLATPRSTGGGAILVSSVLRMLVDGCEIYCHALYTAPVWEPREGAEPGLPCEVWRDDWTVARFKSPAARERWLAFMRGERATK